MYERQNEGGYMGGVKMREVLKTYKDRLVNISGRNRSLILRKVHKKRSFDLYRSFIEQKFDVSILVEYILGDMSKSLLILDDPYKTRKTKLQEFDEIIRQEEEQEIAALSNMMKKQEGLTVDEQEVLKKRRSEIEEKYLTRKEEAKAKIEKNYETALMLSNHLNYLHRETLAIEKETGKYELSIGFPFVEGRFRDGNFVRAPFFLFPIELEVRGNKWYIKNSDSREPMVNKVFLFAANKCHQSRIKDYDDFEFSTLVPDEIEAIVSRELETMGMVTVDDHVQYEQLRGYTNATLPQYASGELFVKSYIVMGQFPISNAIYSDYEALEALDEPDAFNQSLSKLLANESDAEEIDDGMKTHYRQSLYTMMPVDYSQETALETLEKTDQMVIYGPPGTGKSQTISNMVSDALAKGKRVLVVSQKRAALDVLYNRLALIQSKLMLIHDANKDKKNFYEKLRQQLEQGFDIQGLENRQSFEENSVKINDLIDHLQCVERELTKTRTFGITLQEMYTKSEGIFSQEDPRYAYFKAFRDDNPFMTYTYPELNQSFEKLNKQPYIVDTYHKYGTLVDNYHYLPLIRENLNFMEKDRLVKDCEQILAFEEKIQSIDPEIYQAITRQYTLDKQRIDADLLTILAKNYNQEKNGDLVEEAKIGWWNLPGWVKHAVKSKERRDKRQLYEEEEAKYIRTFTENAQAINAMMTEVFSLMDVLSNEGKVKILKALVEPKNILAQIKNIEASIKSYDYYQELMVSIYGLDTIDLMLLEYAFTHGKDVKYMEVMLDNLLEFIILEHIQTIEKTEEFNEFYLYYNRFNQITDEIQALMQNNESQTSKIIHSYWNDQMQIFLGDANYKEMKRQAEKKRRLWPIRNLIFEFTNLLFTMYPCWLMSPETVSEVLPLKNDIFDLIIFDEASQMFVENAIPTIYRGAKIVIAGDDQQLRPTSAFLARVEENDDEVIDIKIAAALEEESLLDLAKVTYTPVHLNYHYRSEFEELIQFSNHAFYNGRLNVSPNRVKCNYDKTAPIERIKVDGRWEDRRNNVEANRIVDLVDQLLRTRNNKESIGIITFNINQKDLIEDLLETRCQIDETFKTLYLEEQQRRHKEEDVSIFVKNIENVQGDERDIIIFSVGYAPNEAGKISVNFGSLSQDGGENRLNVAISRAKKKSYVVTSIEPEVLMVSQTKNRGAKLFKQYLHYAKEVSDQAKERQDLLLQRLSSQESLEAQETDTFVEELSVALRQDGFRVDNHVGRGRYQIDAAIWDENRQAYILGIETDSAVYTSGQSLLERDVYRQRFYQVRDWDVLRVWTYDWWKDRQGVLDQIKKHLDQKSELPESVTKGSQQTTKYHLVGKTEEAVCWYGDKVRLLDKGTEEIFEVLIDGESDEMLNEFKQQLIGKKISDTLAYRNYEYIIESIIKLKK